MDHRILRNPSEAGIDEVPILQVTKLRLCELKWPSQDPTMHECEYWGFSSGCPILQNVGVIIALYCLPIQTVTPFKTPALALKAAPPCDRRQPGISLLWYVAHFRNYLKTWLCLLWLDLLSGAASYISGNRSMFPKLPYTGLPSPNPSTHPHHPPTQGRHILCCYYSLHFAIDYF